MGYTTFDAFSEALQILAQSVGEQIDLSERCWQDDFVLGESPKESFLERYPEHKAVLEGKSSTYLAE